MKRQRLRNAIQLISMLLMPLTFNYLSPYIILSGSFAGTLAGCGVLFLGQLATSLVFGRAFCGWLCPVGAVQAVCAGAQPRPAARWLRFVKYGVWLLWLGAIVAGFVSAGGLKRVDVFYLTDGGVSISAPFWYVFYFGVVFLIVLLSLTIGKRAFCHGFCWMAPFMVVGEKLRDLLRIPGLRLTADAARCVSCAKCSKACPMDLKVMEMVKAGKMGKSECIHCGGCADACGAGAVRMGFAKAPRAGGARPNR